MTRTTRWSAGAGVVCFLMVLAAWLLVISPQRVEAAELRTQRAAVQQQNVETTLAIQQLKVQFAGLAEQKEALVAIQRALPATAGLPTFLRQVTSIAAAAGVNLVSLTPGTPTAVAAASDTTAPAGLYSIGTAIVIDGTYAETTLFLQKLQALGGRAFLVTNLQIGPATAAGSAATTSAGPALSTTITGQIYVLQTPALPVITTPTAG